MPHSAAGSHPAAIDRGSPGLLARIRDLLHLVTPLRTSGPLSDTRGAPHRRGSVALVGAGPGDPELLTVRAVRLIGTADALVYDHLVSADIVSLARPDAQRIYVGKEAGNHTLPQGEINQLLISLAKDGKQVVRLKGGDPFVFGRGGEELEELVDAGVEFEVVPGITAACGISAYAGIPLTHRDHAQSVVFATGHFKDGGTQLDWAALARPRQTIVIYMGVGALPGICGELINHGLSPDTPAALIQNGTTRAQHTLEATLADLPEAAKTAGITPPALLIVGEVVSLRSRLDWFERRIEAWA
ncbi:uroporphyrinogen-III C-methyltransferase [Cognatazoarcus halotolerans]|uniref:uroporphyrinogen-III C-methyltransferase n=1 Tax=Cognatazoarcus halotolerans TaxID=2686016 RepID=UPI00135BADD4|nr:uroporphyrinogen-III C-methyltransferase [Cognatazoarcus halotolerans]MCB1898667.1 uroporphyrinogen-III C-methyltransferase [Rhodocyclaceae bacterium]MCP5309052.1 uroporphyrinogen-III C-methyltransferase [Zoogloeaceae bacterium]